MTILFVSGINDLSKIGATTDDKGNLVSLRLKAECLNPVDLTLKRLNQGMSRSIVEVRT